VDIAAGQRNSAGELFVEQREVGGLPQQGVVAIGGRCCSRDSSQNHNPLKLGERRVRAGQHKIAGFCLGRQHVIKGVSVRHLP